jgi:hypothetical protein
MPRTIAALFDDRGRAEGALQALLEAGIAGYQSALLACRDPRASELAPGRTISPDEGRFGAALRELGLPEPDAAEFEDAVRGGGCMLTVRVDAGTIDKAIALVGAFDPVDLDRRAAKSPAKSPAKSAPTSAAGSGPGAPLGAGLTAGAGPGTTNTAALPGMAGMARSTHDSGAADLRTQEAGRLDRGSNTMATGGLRAEERAGAPGTLALAYRRDTDRTGRVRAYLR